MKTKHRIILALVLVGASCAAIYQVKSKLTAAAARSGPALPQQVTDVSAGNKGAPGKNSAVAESNREPSARPKKNLDKIPSGIDSETWKQSAALVTIMGAIPDGGSSQIQEIVDEELSEEIREIAGMSDDTAAAFQKLVDARNEAAKVAGEGLIKELLSNQQRLTEVISLSLLEKKGTMNPEQKARMKELKPEMNEMSKPYEEQMKPWYSDDRFLTDVRSILNGEGLDDFNEFAAEELRIGLDEKVDELLTGLELDEARRAELSESIKDGKDEDEALEAILTQEESEKLAKLKAKASPF